MESPKIKARDSKQWHYQLQGTLPDPDAIDVPYMVIDEEQDPRPYTDKSTVLAYFSANEAEDYRPYFAKLKRDHPDILGPTNPEWPGNYVTNFTHPVWHKLMFARVEEIVKAGFDGIYIDKLDMVDDIANGNHFGYTASVSDSIKLARAMIDFTEELAVTARVADNDVDFLVFPQNGEFLSNQDVPSSLRYAEKFLECVDGFGVEDMWAKTTSATEQAYRLMNLREARKPVLCVEYDYKSAVEIANAHDACERYGFFFLHTNRELKS